MFTRLWQRNSGLVFGDGGEAHPRYFEPGRVGTPLCPRGNVTEPITATAWANDETVGPPYGMPTFYGAPSASETPPFLLISRPC